MWWHLSDAEKLPDPQPVSETLFSSDMTERHQRSVVQLVKLEQRPLFHQSRNQYVIKKAPAVRQAPVKQNPLSTYDLKGIIYSGRGNSMVFLLHKRDKKSYKLRVGDSFEGWTVKTIEKTAVEFSKGSETGYLNLIKKSNQNK